MASWKSELDDAAVVLLGKFNPAIFQPAWLGATNLVRKEEADGAKIEGLILRLLLFQRIG